MASPWESSSHEIRVTAWTGPLCSARSTIQVFPRTNSISRRAPPLGDAERKFRDNAAYAAWHRREHGVEYCLAPISVMEEELETTVNPEVYDRRFASWWAEWWPHVLWDKLSDEENLM